MGEVLSNFFSVIIDEVESQGGEVLRITADSVIAIWPLSINYNQVEGHMLPSAGESVARAPCVCGQ